MAAARPAAQTRAAQATTIDPIAVTSTGVDSYATLIARQPDGKLLVAGADAGVGFVRRYLGTGELDLAFGTGGTLTLTRVPDAMHLFADDGRVVLTSFDMTYNAWALHLTRVWL